MFTYAAIFTRSRGMYYFKYSTIQGLKNVIRIPFLSLVFSFSPPFWLYFHTPGYSNMAACNWEPTPLQVRVLWKCEEIQYKSHCLGCGQPLDPLLLFFLINLFYFFETLLITEIMPSFVTRLSYVCLHWNIAPPGQHFHLS